jgi:hypothetical protein
MPSGSGKLIRIALDFLKKVRKRSGGHHAPAVPTKPHLPSNAPHGLGPLRPPARQMLKNEDVLIDSSHGLQSRTEGLFTDVRHGTHGDLDSKYLWTIDHRGVNVAHELTPFPTPRGNIVHSNISSEASIGGEAWFGPNNSVTINAGSGRFGDAAGITRGQWDAASQYWSNLGYNVTPIPYGQR